MVASGERGQTKNDSVESFVFVKNRGRWIEDDKQRLMSPVQEAGGRNVLHSLENKYRILTARGVLQLKRCQDVTRQLLYFHLA